MAVALLDVNILIYAYDPGAPLHKEARAWLESTLSGEDTVLIPFLAVTAFLRIMTNQKLSRLQMRIDNAIESVEALLAAPNVRLVHTDEEHWRMLKRVVAESGVSGRSVTDAQFATLAMQNGDLVFDGSGFRPLRAVELDQSLREPAT